MASSSPWRRKLSAVGLACSLAAAGSLIAPRVMAKPTEASAPSLPHVAARLARGALLRIVAFGSSSTEGVGATSPAASYPSRLEAYLRTILPGPVEVLNAGIGGQDVDEMARRVPAVILLRPDLVIWQTGSNDPLRDVPLERFVTQTRAGIAEMHAAGIDVMLMGPQDCAALRAEPDAGEFRDALQQIGADMHVPVIRRFDLMHTWLAEGRLSKWEMMSGDGLHMTDGGYAILAAEVGRQILALSGRATTRHAGIVP